MLDNNDLLVAIKKSAVEAVEAMNPTALVFGKVTSSSPLKINVEQKMTLTAAQLVLTRNVTNHTVNVTMNWTSENAVHDHSYTDDGSSMTTGSNTHNHQVKGAKSITIHNGLVVGDGVVLMRMQGGQKYLVLDRVVTI